MTGRTAIGLRVLAATVLPFGAAQAVSVDFESYEANAAPQGFTIARTGNGADAVWLVREEVGAPSGGKVLVQTSTDSTSYRFPLCVYDAFTGTDVDVGVRFKAISGSVDQAAGIVWRYRDPDNYYVVRANALEGNVVLYKVENGKRSDLKPTDAGWLFSYGKKADVPGGRWNELRVKARGARFEVILNGSHVFDIEDETFSGPGKVGLWTKADSVTAFDNLAIEAIGNR
jgi:hypothetical protein